MHDAISPFVCIFQNVSRGNLPVYLGQISRAIGKISPKVHVSAFFQHRSYEPRFILSY